MIVLHSIQISTHDFIQPSYPDSHQSIVSLDGGLKYHLI